MEPINQEVMTQALALGNLLAFGAMQVFLKTLPGEYKPVIYTVLASFVTAVMYFGITSGNPIVQIAVMALSGAVGTTGGVNFIKEDVMRKLTTVKEATPV